MKRLLFIPIKVGENKKLWSSAINDHSERVDGMKVSMLAQKLSKANTSGYTGVSRKKIGSGLFILP